MYTASGRAVQLVLRTLPKNGLSQMVFFQLSHAETSWLRRPDLRSLIRIRINSTMLTVDVAPIRPIRPMRDEGCVRVPDHGRDMSILAVQKVSCLLKADATVTVDVSHSDTEKD